MNYAAQLRSGGLPERWQLLSLIGIGENNRNRIVAVLRAYIDDTGTHDKPGQQYGQQPGSDVTGAVGYVATVPGWGKFDRDWRVALKDEGIGAKDFHAFDLQWKTEAFDGWSDTRRDAFVERLSKIINRHLMFGVGGLVLAQDFDKMPQGFKHEIKHPYFIGVHNLLNQFISGPFVPELQGRKVNFFFERMKPFFESEVALAFDRIRDVKASHVLGKITLGGDKATMLPLHAADLAAYHVRAEVSRLHYKPQLAIRPAMEALKKRYRLSLTYSDRDTLRDLYFQMVIERARRA